MAAPPHLRFACACMRRLNSCRATRATPTHRFHRTSLTSPSCHRRLPTVGPSTRSTSSRARRGGRRGHGRVVVMTPHLHDDGAITQDRSPSAAGHPHVAGPVAEPPPVALALARFDEAPPTEWMENNRKWINQQMDDSRHIIDIGPEPGRPGFPEPTSRYFDMERREILRRQYHNYSQDQQL